MLLSQLKTTSLKHWFLNLSYCPWIIPLLLKSRIFNLSLKSLMPIFDLFPDWFNKFLLRMILSVRSPKRVFEEELLLFRRVYSRHKLVILLVRGVCLIGIVSFKVLYLLPKLMTFIFFLWLISLTLSLLSNRLLTTSFYKFLILFISSFSLIHSLARHSPSSQMVVLFVRRVSLSRLLRTYTSLPSRVEYLNWPFLLVCRLHHEIVVRFRWGKCWTTLSWPNKLVLVLQLKCRSFW
jgi:hypothetical protein